MLHVLWTPTEVRLASMGSKVWTETTKERLMKLRKARGLPGQVTTIASSAAQHVWPQKKGCPLYTTAWMKVVEPLLTLVDMEIDADIRLPPLRATHTASHTVTQVKEVRCGRKGTWLPPHIHQKMVRQGKSCANESQQGQTRSEQKEAGNRIH